jgi:hypothetical protein
LLFDDYHFKDNDLVKFQNTPIKDELTKENIKQLIINEFKKCNGTNVLIFYLKPHYTPIDSSLHNFLITKIKNINILNNTIIKYIFPNFNEIKQIYTIFYKKYCEEYNIAIAHFRGGDFERFNNYDFFKILPVNYYIEKIVLLMESLKNKKKLLLLCCFHPNDLIFI